MIYIEPSANAVRASSVSYRNVLAEGTFFYTNQTPDGAALNALGPQTFDAWAPSALPAAVSSLLPEAVECDCAAVIAHTLGSSGATMMVQASVTGSSWVTLATITPQDDSDIFVIFTAQQAYPRWRIIITGTTPPAIGIAWIGPRLLIPYGVPEGFVPLSKSLNVDVENQVTEGGQYRGSYIRRVGASTGISLGQQDRWWVDDVAQPFIEHYNLAKPFIFAACPELLPQDAHYCWRAGGTLAGSLSAGSQYYDMSMDVAAYVSRP